MRRMLEGLRKVVSPLGKTIVRELLVVACGGWLAEMTDSAIPWFVAMVILAVILICQAIVSRRLPRVDSQSEEAPPARSDNVVVTASESKPVPTTEESRTVTPSPNTEEHNRFVLGTLTGEIEWLANRSAVKWLDGLSFITYPVEHARVANREAKLYSALEELGVRRPGYGDGRWKDFWVELVFISECRDLSKARSLLDDLGPPKVG